MKNKKKKEKHKILCLDDIYLKFKLELLKNPKKSSLEILSDIIKIIKGI